MMALETAQQSVLKVGEGRGFVVEGEGILGPERYIVTAAHCLPKFPPAASISFVEERSYTRLLGPIGEREPIISAQCVFVDPIGDVAVLASPDLQNKIEEAEAYEQLTRAAAPLSVWDGSGQCEAYLLSLDCRWFSCSVQCNAEGGFWVSGAVEPIVGGMSGSPVVDSGGAAIGVICCSGGRAGRPHFEGGPYPLLVGSLSGWLLWELVEVRRRSDRV